jgi:diguanylate cyclase (GGDEF)-like protein/putative nucleotidyltransferase with HDIG domain
VPILTIGFYAYKVYLDKVESSNNHAEEMAELHLRTIEALAIAIDAKDEVTHDHVRRVQIYSTGLARLFGLSDGEIEALKAGALLHDIGKLAVPDYILNKPGHLTPAEFEKMKVHTIVGAEILERVGFPYPVAPVVRHHHERWDGRGYPDGLRADQIPITARILTVADCFDAVREDRQYRKAMTQEEAIRFLREGGGTVFDPSVVGVFLDHLDEFEAEIRGQGVDRTFAEPQMEKGILMPPQLNTGPKVYEHIRSAHREVVALYGIAETIGTSLDLRDTFAVFSSRLLDIVSYTTCVLYLQRHDTLEVEIAHVSGRDMERFKGKKMPSGAGLSGWVIANRHPMHNCDPRLDLDAMQMDAAESYKVATVVPLIKDGSALGALALYSADLTSYDADHLRLIEAVAKLASDAIANAVHHEKTETSALTDMLTGLPNARALRYKFEEAADRARRHKDSFSVVMMDLDGFKAINDQLGHQAGDHLLRDVARVLLAQLRSSDFVTRYAGDEFVAVLNIGPEEVHELIRRLQRAVDKHEFPIDGNALYIGLSVGWASFGRDGESLDELLLAADRSMYSDKAKRKSITTEGQTFRTSDLSRYSIM